MKKLQTLTTSTAIALASVGAPAFAQEAQATSVPTDTAVNEPALVAKSQVKPLEKSEVPAPSTVKPALNAQKAVVKEAEAKIDTAKADVKEKEATVASIETEYSNADKAVNDAQAIASQVTPAKVAEVKDAQAKNLEAQTTNQEATEATNAQIKSETKVLAEKQSDVATAKENLDQAEKDVQTAEQTVANAESALDGTGLANAEKDLKDAQKGVKDAEATVNEAETAFATAKKADETREDAIKSAINNVNVKNDALKLAKEMMDADQNKVDSIQTKADATASTEKEAQTALDAQKARSGEAVIKMGNPVHHLTDKEKAYYGLDKNDITFSDAKSYYVRNRYKKDGKANELMLLMGAKMYKALTVDFNKNDANRKVDIDNLKDAEIIEISDFYAKLINALRENMGYPKENRAYVAQDTLEHSKKKAKAYEARGTDPVVAGHISENNGPENMAGIYGGERISTMLGLKYAVLDAFKRYSFLDGDSNWGHLDNQLGGILGDYDNGLAMTVANINGNHWFINSFGSDGKHKINLNKDLAQLEAKLVEAQKQNSQAQDAFANAKAELAAASRKYASALDAKTQAEKELASKTATPLQTEVAEKNLQLANLALTNAKKREAQASEAVANFSASLADKKTALEKAQDALKSAKTAKTIASQALENASAKLEDQETKLDKLNKQVTKLLAEKDALVKEAKELAEQLQAYLDAPVALTKAKQARTAVSVKLELAKSDLEMAQSKLENLLTAQKAEEAKLAEIEATYAKLVDLAEKAQENVVATLPDGTVIAVPKVAPTTETLPELNLDALVKEDAKDSTVKQLPDGTIVAIPKDAPVAEELPTANVDELKKALDAGKEVTLDAQGNVVVRETKPATYEKPVNVDRPQAKNDKSNKDYASDKNVTIDNKGNVITKGQTYTSQQQVSDKPTYSRVERAKTLPNTGTKESNLTLFVLAILSGLGIALKRRQGK